MTWQNIAWNNSYSTGRVDGKTFKVVKHALEGWLLLYTHVDGRGRKVSLKRQATNNRGARDSAEAAVRMREHLMQ